MWRKNQNQPPAIASLGNVSFSHELKGPRKMRQLEPFKMCSGMAVLHRAREEKFLDWCNDVVCLCVRPKKP